MSISSESTYKYQKVAVIFPFAHHSSKTKSSLSTLLGLFYILVLPTLLCAFEALGPYKIKIYKSMECNKLDNMDK